MKDVAKFSRDRMQYLPEDFLSNHSPEEVKEIAKLRGFELLRQVKPSIRDPYGAIVDAMPELCKSQAREYVLTGLELYFESGTTKKYAKAVSQVASTHTTEFLQDFVSWVAEEPKYSELVKLLIQESVLRGVSFEQTTSVTAFWKTLQESGDKMTWLPLHRTELETSLNFPIYSPNPTPGPAPRQDPPIYELTCPNLQRVKFSSLAPNSAATECIRNWSHPKLENRLFLSDAELSPADISSVNLLALQLDCLQGGTEETVRLQSIASSTAFDMIFSKAAYGGAYTHGEQAAYGRLISWHSIRGLCGGSETSTFSEVHDLARNSKWFSMGGELDWFYPIGVWDLAIVCLRPDNRHVAILAITDTD